MIQELEDPLESMLMVDALQCLCIDYHFEEEINSILRKHYQIFNSSINADLHDIALHFRLLRQAGYFVPIDVLNKFIDKKGQFRLELSEDMRGLKSLYEASHLGMEEDTLLDETKDFACKHLKAKMATLKPELARAVDQPLEWYIWPMTVLSDPKHSEQRIDLTKPISLVYIIDDIFDVYGTLDELILFTEAVNRWEPMIIDRLPDYMKICFKTLDNTTNEISDKVLREHGWNPISTLRKEWASLCDAFLVEPKWFASREVPKAKDYLKNGATSSGLPLVLVHAFFLLGQGLSNESVDCVENTPAQISHAATILRLWDDLGNVKKGQFRLELSEDMRGLKSLYEASHLGMEEDTFLDEAKDFACKHLKAKMATLKPELARAVGEILEHPYHNNLARFNLAKHYQNSYGTYSTYGWISPLRELARMDFNIVQSLYQQELLQIFKWWTDMGLSKQLKFARDQPLKWYLWPMTVLSDPKHSKQRIELTKPISLVYIIDDIFDVYGTLDELILFTEAVNKWEPMIIDRLPDYMKICFKALDNTTNEISDKVLREHGWNPISTLRKEWASLCDAFLVEAKWFASREVPKAKDYLKNGVISSGLPLVLVHAFFLLGQGLSKESVDCVEHTPALISHPAKILRLWDDLGSAKDEKQEGHDGSYLECYMKEHGVASIESPQDHVFNMISDSWKQLNKECHLPSPFSHSFKKVSLNFARMVPVMYSYNEDQCLPTLDEYINLLLYKNIPP
ncbi:hypothetical protein NE237_016626 [Protea cynaroides]|uniref:Terpene synthase metal-binding domain-containing protein n=1 Tax=Protea cynaroides TaxID=273540 RepID=A0A9Q0HE69_9MAGN|nr:hypothetical protein NE237_016626 [Protea cynaroides]